MNTGTKVRHLATRAALLLGALAALAIAVNLSWFDEALHPEIERLAQPRPVAMEGNAYPLVYGLPAADDRDPLAAGLAVVEALRERHRQGQAMGLGAAEMAEIFGGSELDTGWRTGFESLPCNSRLSLDCADRLLADIARGAAEHPRLAVLLERYERLIAVPRFEENQEFDITTPVPAYDLLLTVGRIRLATSYHGDEITAFLLRAAEDMGFWRVMLGDGRSLIAKMVALAGIRNNLELLSAALRNGALHEEEIDAMQRFLRPLTAEERNIGEAFLSELRIALLSGKTVVLAPAETSPMTRLLLQERATVNEYYLTTVTPLRVRAALDAAAFYEQRGFENLVYDLRVFPPPLYNLGGKLLLKRQAQNSNFQAYVSRVHDLDGRIALVLLQAEIERNPGRSVQSVVAASAYRNPYTGEPMDYDSATSTLSFRCLGDTLTDVCAVAIGR